MIEQKVIFPQQYLTYDEALCEKYRLPIYDALFFDYLSRAIKFKPLRNIHGVNFFKVSYEYDIKQKLARFGWNKTTFWRHVKKLELCGLIRRTRIGNDTYVSPLETKGEEYDSTSKGFTDHIKIVKKPESKRKGEFSKPTIDELNQYARENKYYHFDAERFYDHYESVGWVVGNKPMKDWQASVRIWLRNTSKYNPELIGKKNSNVLAADPCKKFVIKLSDIGHDAFNNAIKIGDGDEIKHDFTEYELYIIGEMGGFEKITRDALDGDFEYYVRKIWENEL